MWHTGICHTDVNCHHGRAPTPFPVVLGHEGAGVVLDVGSRVGRLTPGARVVMTFAHCGRCRICLSGRPAYCVEALAPNFMTGRADGSSAFERTDVRCHFFAQSSFATLSMANVRNVIQVPDRVPLEHAAALGCGVQTGAGAVLNSLQVRPGSSIAVFGAGAVGLSAVMAACIAGASTVIAVDPVSDRRGIATRLGATHSIATGADAAAEVADLTGGGVDYSVEASGNPAALAQAVDSLGSGGVCAAVGALNEPASPAWRDVRLKGATIRGVVEGDANPALFLPRLLAFHADGRFPFDALTTRYGFTEIDRAIADAESGTAIKPVLDMGHGP